MDDGSNKRINEGSDPEKPTLKGLQLRLKGSNVKDHNGDAVCDTPSSDRSLPALNGQEKAGSDTEEGKIIGSPDAHAESKQQSGDHGLPPSTEENVADHEAVSDHNLGKRKRVGDTTCRLCGRNFPSMKSLYGHMRKHARNWKGVSPPPENKTQVPIPATDFNNSNAVLPPLNWSVKTKRGRKVNAAANRKYEEESEDPVINAANTLMLLASGGFPVRQQQSRNPVQHDSRVMNNEDDLKLAILLDSMKVDSTQMDNVDKTEGMNQNIDRSVMDCDRTADTPSSSKPATDLVADRKQYSCSTCNKSFSTPQALGGHTASHNKNKSNAGVGILVGTEEAKLAQAEGLITLPMKVSEHRCKTCGLVFPTGQALGGHMRKHWLGPENVVAPSAENRPENVVAPSAENRPQNFVAPSTENRPENVVAPSAENRPENFVAPSAENGSENFVAPSAENGQENFVAPRMENHSHLVFDLNEPAQPEDDAE